MTFKTGNVVNVNEYLLEIFCCLSKSKEMC